MARKGGRESSVISKTNLPESLGVVSTSTPPFIVSKVFGFSPPSIMMGSINVLPLVSDFHPCTSSDELQASPAPLPTFIPGETYGSMQRYEQATSECLSDDLDVWTTGDTGYGWGVPVDPGLLI